MKLIIAGSRLFNQLALLNFQTDVWVAELGKIHPGKVIIVSGTASGADRLGEEYARMRNLQVIRMPADWTKYGRPAGYIRNEEMAKIADACIVFWNGKSPGTKHMIHIANKYKLPLKIVYYDQGTVR